MHITDSQQIGKHLKIYCWVGCLWTYKSRGGIVLFLWYSRGVLVGWVRRLSIDYNQLSYFCKEAFCPWWYWICDAIVFVVVG